MTRPVPMREAGKNYRGPKVRKGAQGSLTLQGAQGSRTLHTFFVFLGSITHVIRRWSVVLSVHAASDHIANDALHVLSLFVPVPVRPCRGARKIFSSGPEPTLCGPAYDSFHSIDNFTSMLRTNFDYRTLYHCCIQPDLDRYHISSNASY